MAVDGGEKKGWQEGCEVVENPIRKEHQLTKNDINVLVQLCYKAIEDVKERARHKAENGEDMEIVAKFMTEVNELRAIITRLKLM